MNGYIKRVYTCTVIISRMPAFKRYRSHTNGQFKRRKYNSGRYTKKVHRERFINQLGGWSVNKPGYRKALTVEQTSNLNRKTLVIPPGSSQTFDFAATFTDLLPTNYGFRNTFQRVKLKKLEMYVEIFNEDGSGSDRTFLLSLAKFRQGDVLSSEPGVPTEQANARTIQGCQPKMFRLGSDTPLEIMRIACFYPPLQKRIATDSTSNADYNIEDGYVSTNAVAGNSPIWKTFILSIQPSASGSTDNNLVASYYFKSTWICKELVFRS